MHVYDRRSILVPCLATFPQRGRKSLLNTFRLSRRISLSLSHFSSFLFFSLFLSLSDFIRAPRPRCHGFYILIVRVSKLHIHLSTVLMVIDDTLLDLMKGRFSLIYRKRVTFKFYNHIQQFYLFDLFNVHILKTVCVYK